MVHSQVVDLSFQVSGAIVPADHAYAAYGGISRLLPQVHGADWIGIHGISGRYANGRLAIDRGGRLRLRVPSARIPEMLALVGQVLDIAGHRVRIGNPTVEPLVPAAILDARIVVIRLTNGLPKPFDAEVFQTRFLAEARRQLVALDIRGELAIIGRQRIAVGGQRVVGCSLRCAGLSAEHSLVLQASGLGGKRTMGCGIFRAARIKQGVKQAAA